MAKSATTPTPLVVSVSTTAELLDCSKSHVYQLMERGKLRRVQLDGSTAIRIPIEDVYACAGIELPAEVGGAA